MIATALTGGAMLASPVIALAQSPAAAQQKAADYNIPAQDLSGALRQFAETSRLQLIYDAKATAGKQSAGVTGRLTPDAALSRILAGSGLGYAFSGTAVTIAPAASEATTAAAGPRVLAPVRVQGDDTGGSPVNGINGSRDVTATEGTGSYTSGALNIVSKMAQSIKDTPQSVSVITAQQIADENLNDLSTALTQAPGVTVINTSGTGPQQSNFYSRGFQITTLQVDGGAPLDIQTQFAFSPNLDLSEYDSLQIVRGADGLFGGYGNPSGVIDLVRKKPLDHNQITTDTEIGSWNLYRETVDVSGPVTADKNLKVRAVASYQTNDYFYTVAKNNQYHLYTNIEYDFSSNTYLNVGASYDQHRSVPNASGVPSYVNGGVPPLSVSDCLCFPWSRDNTISTEAFAQLNHKFNKDWSVKLDLTYTDQSQYFYGGGVSGPVTLTDPTATATAGEFQYANTQYLVDFTVNGAFELFGHQQTLVVGGNYQNASGPISSYYGLTFPGATPPSTTPSVNIYTFNPNSPQYARATGAVLANSFPSNGQEQYTLYANTKITPIDKLHILLGLRYSGYSYANTDQSYCGGFLLQFGLCTVAGAPSGTPIVAKYSDTHFSWPIDAGVIYDVTKDLSAYISYTDIYISNGQTLQLNGNPVDPTTGYNEEIGLKWQAPNKKLNATLSLYNILQTNFPWFDGFGKYASTFGAVGGGIACCYDTAGHSELSQGVDIEVAGELAPGWNLTTSYSFDRTENKGIHNFNVGGPTYSQQPRNLFKLYTTYKFQSEGWLNRLSIGGGLNAQSTTTESGYQFFMQQKAYALMSLRAAYQIDKVWNLALDINNVTDTKYFQSLPAAGGGGFYGQPTAYTLTLKSKW